MFLTLVSSLILSLLVSSIADAQTNTITTVEPIDSAAVKAAWARADTGRMMPGYHDLTRYDTPGYCVAAIKGMERLIWRRGESDTLPKQTDLDTIPERAREVGRACLAKMTPGTVPYAELYNFTRAALWVGDTALARQAVEYHLSVSPDDARERGYILVDAMVEARDSRPMQLSFLESLVPKFAELGEGAARAHADAIGILRQVAHYQFDTTRMLKYSAERESLIQSLTPEVRKKHNLSLGNVFSDSLEIIWYKLIPDLAPTIERLGNQWATAGEVDRDFARVVIAMATLAGEMAGKDAKSVDMYKRFPSNASLIPQKGRVTLVLALNRIGRGRMDNTLSLLRRLHDRYHEHGFDVILVGRTSGYAWDSPPLNPDDEANLFGWYYREYLNLPFSVFVEETSFYKKPDGRKVAEPTPFQSMYKPLSLTRYLIGRDGTITPLNYGFHHEVELEAYLKRELGKPASETSKAE